MAGPVEIGTGAGGPEEAGARKVRINGAPATGRRPARASARALADAGDGRAVHRARRRPAALPRPAGAVDRSGHGRRALDYERAMRSRNRLLAEGRADPVWLDGIEAQMAELGSAIAAGAQRTGGAASPA